MIGTLDHAHHRLRRAALNPYFSKQAVAKLEPIIRTVIENLCRSFREAKGKGVPINLNHAFATLTMDIITEYSFSKSYGCVDEPDFAKKWPEVVEGISVSSHINKQF